MLEFSEDRVNAAHEISDAHINHVVASKMMTGLTKKFDNKEIIAALVKQRLE